MTGRPGSLERGMGETAKSCFPFFVFLGFFLTTGLGGDIL